MSGVAIGSRRVCGGCAYGVSTLRQHPRAAVAYKQRGFTLLEILVALVIISVLASSVSLALPNSEAAERRASALAWQQQAQWAARQAYARGEDWAWEIRPGEARLLKWQDGHWLPAEERQAAPLALAPGVSVSRLEVDGQVLGDQGRIVFGTVPPIFRLQWQAGSQQWQLLGQANGQISFDGPR